MFNIGPLELVALALIGLVLLGPDKLPEYARDAARMLRSLRDMATGARHQLKEELGPEFADIDLRSLNPKTALQRALLGDDDEPPRSNGHLSQASSNGSQQPSANGQPMANGGPPAQRPQQPPLGRGEQAPFDSDAT